MTGTCGLTLHYVPPAQAAQEVENGETHGEKKLADGLTCVNRDLSVTIFSRIITTREVRSPGKQLEGLIARCSDTSMKCYYISALYSVSSRGSQMCIHGELL